MSTSEEPFHMRVGGHKRKFVYADYSKHRFHEGTPEMVVSGLGSAIVNAVAVVELLKSQGLVVVKNVKTSRGGVESARSSYANKIDILIVKSADFEKIYEEQQLAKDQGGEEEKEGNDE